MVRRLRIRKILDGRRRERHPQHPPLAIHAHRQKPHRIRRLLEPRRQVLRPFSKLVVKPVLRAQVQRRNPRRHPDRVPAQRPRLINRPDRTQLLHQLLRPRIRRHWHPAPDHFSQARDVRLDLARVLIPAKRHAKPRHHLIKDEHRPAPSARLARSPRKSGSGRTNPMFPATGSTITAASELSCSLTIFVTASRSLYGASSVSRATSAGTPGE